MDTTSATTLHGGGWCFALLPAGLLQYTGQQWLVSAAVPAVTLWALVRSIPSQRLARVGTVAPAHGWLFAALCLWIGALIFANIFLSAAAFTLWVTAWIAPLLPHQHRRLIRAWPLLFLATPWLDYHAEALSVALRMSSAESVTWAIAAMGMPVQQFGTEIHLGNGGVELAAACSGLATLHAVLLIGGALTLRLMPQSSYYWFMWPLLFLASWMVNGVRAL